MWPVLIDNITLIIAVPLRVYTTRCIWGGITTNSSRNTVVRESTKFEIRSKETLAGFEAFKAASMIMAVIWVVAHCSVVRGCLRFRGSFCLIMRAVGNGSMNHLRNVGIKGSTSRLRKETCLHRSRT